MYTELTCVHSIDSRQVVLVHYGLHYLYTPKGNKDIKEIIISIIRTFGQLYRPGKIIGKIGCKYPQFSGANKYKIKNNSDSETSCHDRS